jgi:peptidoglycan/LPS O-acetylase OafA/YrhL
MSTPVRSATPNPAGVTDPEAGFSVADPGKAWRRGHQIPVVPTIDGFRAFATVGIVLFHIFQVAGVFALVGGSVLGELYWGLLPRSLDALFIISGFVIYLPTAARNGDFGSVGSFAIRRVARLVPAYYISLLIALLLLATVSPSPGLPDGGTVAAHFAMLQTPALLVAGDFQLGFGVIPPVWTLSVEAGLYLVVPLVAAHYFRHPIVGLGAAAGIVLFWSGLAHHADSVASLFGRDLSSVAENRIDLFYASQFPSWSLAFASGMTGAWAYLRLRDRIDPERLARGAVRAVALALPVFALFVYLAGHGAVTDSNPFAGLYARQSSLIALGYPLSMAALMMSLALAPAWVQRPFTIRPSRWIGDISYAIYLIHFAVIWVALREFSFPNDGEPGAVLAWCALVFPLSIGYAYLSARLVERPVRRWAQRFGRRAQAAGEARVAAGAG